MERLTFTKDEQNTLILAGHILSGSSTGNNGPGALLISGGLIKEVLTSLTPCQARELFPETKILDFSSLTLLPPLVDCHVHLAFDGKDFEASVRQWTQPVELQKRLDQELASYVQRGILAVRDGGDRGNIGFQARGISPLPLVLSPGKALFRKGCYGSFLGEGIDTVEEGIALINRLHREGADFIKIIVSGIVSFREFSKVGPVQFLPGELAQLTDAAHGLGLKVMAHASSDEGVATAIAAGVDSIEHGFFLTPKSMEAMGTKNIAWVPTVVPMTNQLTEGCRNYSPEEKDIIRRTSRFQLKMIKEASRLGVILGIGTDAGATGVPHGQSFIDEVNLFQEAGLSSREILRAATLNGAWALGLTDRLGRISPGMPANFIGVKGNPLDNLAYLNELRLISICSD